MNTIIYHGTPLTPRSALKDVGVGRAMCVSFFRPDDVEVVEAISPDIMFRQRRLFILAGCPSAWRGLERDGGLASVLRVAGASPFHAGPLGHHARHSWSAVPAQRQHPERLAIRAEGISGLAYGWADGEAAAAMRSTRPGLPWLDWAERWITRLSRAHGRSGQGVRQPLAGRAHAARDRGGLRLSVCLSRQHQPRAERLAV